MDEGLLRLSGFTGSGQETLPEPNAENPAPPDGALKA